MSVMRLLHKKNVLLFTFSSQLFLRKGHIFLFLEIQIVCEFIMTRALKWMGMERAR